VILMTCRFPRLVRHIPLSCRVILMTCRFPHLVKHSHTFMLSGVTYKLQVHTFGEVLSDFEVVR